MRSCDAVIRQGGVEFVILRPAMARAQDTALSCVRYRPDNQGRSCWNSDLDLKTEIIMYIGGGILGTILLVALIVWVIRRA